MSLLHIILIAAAAWVLVLVVVVSLLRASARGDAADAWARRREGLSLETTDDVVDPSPGAVLARVMELAFARDPASGRHAVTVAHYARRLAIAAGLPAGEQEIVHTAGLLHDIDDQAFADTLARSDRELDPAGRHLVERHATVGVHVLHELPDLGPVAAVVAACHEHVDGSGYPRGRRAEQIPRGARIVAVAEVYDLLTAADASGVATGPAEAAVELRRMAGRRLDPALVERFLADVVGADSADTAAAESAPLRMRIRDELRILRRSRPFPW